ncbi:MAG: hypothetical protein RRA94_09550, partial [Bacteroidota bacterium]|nr:hypothetical protein [Bacteroidota bacterium]
GRTAEALPVTKGERLHYTSEPFGAGSAEGKPLTIATVGPALVMNKSIAAVNGKAYSSDTLPVFAPGEAKKIDVLFSVTNEGSAIAEDVSLCASAGSYFVPSMKSPSPGCSIVDGRIEASYGSLLPGETRNMTFTFDAAERSCAMVYDSSILLHTFTTRYSGSYALSGTSHDAVFTVTDEEALDFPAYDFQLLRLAAAAIEGVPGATVPLRATVINGVTPVRDLAVTFYAIVDAADTLLLDHIMLEELESNSQALLAIDAVIPAEAKCIEYFAVIDARNSFGEFCEYNNAASVHLPLRGAGWIMDVAGFPNPVANTTRISYLLTREVRHLTLTFYDLEGRRIGEVLQLPGDIGRHTAPGNLGTFSSGTYLYTFEAVDLAGVRQRYTGRLVKL